MNSGQSRKVTTARTGSTHMPAGSIFYEKVLPALLVLLGLILAGLLLFAAGVLLGVVPF